MGRRSTRCPGCARQRPASTVRWAACYVGHVAALAAGDPVGLDATASGFQRIGMLLFAAEAAAAAAAAHAHVYAKLGIASRTELSGYLG